MSDATNTTGRVATPRQALTAAVSGSFLEWYDFFLFGTAAGLIFPTLFFPNSSPTAGVIESFGTFAAGFLMRPVGAVLFGHFGDRIGRRRMLLITVTLMGGCTFLIGLLPTYNTIGALAPALLVLLRLIQGVGIGGEFGGGALVALENAPTGRRGIMGSIHQLGTPVGLLVSTGAFALVQLLPEPSLNSWGWRIPFLISGLFLFVALYIRRALPETETFQSDQTRQNRVPLLALIKNHPKNVLIAIGARMADAVTFNVINVFGIAFASTHLGMSKQAMLNGFVLASAVEIAVVPIVGLLSDRIGRRPIYMFGIVVCGVLGFAYFPALASGSVALAWLMIVLMLAIGTGCMFALQGTLFAEMFSTHTRYTGIGVAYQTSALIGGAPTPAIATALAAAFSQSYWPVAIYLGVICAISLVCLILAKETFRDSLTSDRATA
ncbi:MFS transporter [Microlunatus soli]|uniref:Putative proline/betaine transporter n=1 Tax=Microlunatus soli TaxID=630515 RepID=A0A1H1TR27_9ACTN|nr:MFS transporter [Microlunatus soli]SDS62680.1 Major Facilitator Superfamily protein [Microlunatus soli]